MKLIENNKTLFAIVIRQKKVLQNMVLCVTFGITEAFTLTLFGILFTYEALLLIVTLAICLHTARSLL